MNKHQASMKYAERMRNYYRELSFRRKAGDDFSELDNFLDELRELMRESSPQAELRRVANGGWA
jgi:hypothetical protein